MAATTSQLGGGSTSTTNHSIASNGLSRTRSARTGTPLSARGAARKPATAADTAEADARAEIQARVDDLAEKLAVAEQSTVDREKQMAIVQARLDESLHEQGILEDSVHEKAERIEELENAKKESTRARREMEQIYEAERAASIKEKEEAATREAEMRNALQRMKETLAQREMRAGLDDERRPVMSRSASGRSAATSPNPDSSDAPFAPSSSMQRSDSVSRNNSKLVMQKDKIIESLRLELAEAHVKVVEMEHMGGGHLRELQNKIYEIKMQNARLMEENESFQLLLSEKTLNGDFLRVYNTNVASRPPSRSPEPPGEGPGTSLADELGSEDDGEGGGDTERRLRAEVGSLKDQNKALTLYINNIISRLLQHEQFEQILDKTPDLMSGAPSLAPPTANKDKDLPPPPPAPDTPSLLQRAKSVMGPKSSAGARRPRPLSQQLGGESSAPPRGNENPETAPSVPIASRMTSGHRRANSDWPAASVVTNMYRGPSIPVGPLSPGLSSPSGRSSAFFSRVPSGSSVPTISETGAKDDTMPPPALAPRDSKLHSNRNSTIFSSSSPNPNPDFAAALDIAASETAQSFPSPPRSTTSSGGDKQAESTKGSIGSAVMMGSKPRPLRLVQEAKEVDDAKKNAAAGGGQRGSWFGWMNKGTATTTIHSVPGPGLGIGGMGGGGRSNSDQSGGPTPAQQQQQQ